MRTDSIGSRRLARILVASAGLAFLICAGARASAPKELSWLGSWKDATEVAAREMRPILLDFSDPTCGDCHLMASQFWGDPEVRPVAERFVRVRVNYDGAWSLRERFKVSRIPTVIVLDPWQNPLGRLSGWSGRSKSYLMLLQAVPADFAPLAADSRAAAAGEADGLTYERLGDFYFRGPLAGASRDFYRRAESSRALESEPARRAGVRAQLGWCELKLGSPDDAREWFEKALDGKAQPEHPDVALAGLAIAWAQLGKPERGGPVLERLRREFPDSQMLPLALQQTERTAHDGG